MLDSFFRCLQCGLLFDCLFHPMCVLLCQIIFAGCPINCLTHIVLFPLVLNCAIIIKLLALAIWQAMDPAEPQNVQKLFGTLSQISTSHERRLQDLTMATHKLIHHMNQLSAAPPSSAPLTTVTHRALFKSHTSLVISLLSGINQNSAPPLSFFRRTLQGLRHLCSPARLCTISLQGATSESDRWRICGGLSRGHHWQWLEYHRLLLGASRWNQGWAQCPQATWPPTWHHPSISWQDLEEIPWPNTSRSPLLPGPFTCPPHLLELGSFL